MPLDASYMTAEKLIAYAAERGEAVSEDQLDRWRKRGLVPSASPGRGQGKGRLAAHYPPSAGQQLVAVAGAVRVLQDLDAVLWIIWWNGGVVAEKRVHALIEKARTKLERTREWIDDTTGSAQNEDAFARFEKRARSRIKDPSFAQFRKKVGKDQFVTFSRLAVSAVAGSYESHDPADLSRLSKQFPSFAPAFITKLFEFMARLHAPERVRAGLEYLKPGDLEKARDELRAVVATFGRFVSADPATVRAIIGGPLPPFMQDGLAEFAINPAIEMFLGWLALRPHPLFGVGLRVLNVLADRPPAEWPPILAAMPPEGP